MRLLYWNTIGTLIVLLIIFLVVELIESKPEPKTLQFEFRKKDSCITMDGFLHYKGQWCGIVLNDSMAVIYQ